METLHKLRKPISPVLSYFDRNNKILSIKLNSVAKNYSYISKQFIKSSSELTQKVKEYSVPTMAELVSFDVVSMFSKKHPKECLLLTENLLETKNKQLGLINEIKQLFKICTNYFRFSFQRKNLNIYENLSTDAGGIAHTQ